jgi:energy-converting hydrogenase Eha subunit G
MLVAILALFDIISGITIFYSVKLLFGYLAYIIFFKGLISVISSIRRGDYLEWMGPIDLITGIALALMSFGFQSYFFTVMAWLIFLKGFYSFIRDAFNI